MSIYLTFDTDHMSEARMASWLDQCPIPGNATFFCGEKFDCLRNTRHEIAPHPDLHPAPSWKDEMARYRDMFPEAHAWRSHSLMFSQSIAVEAHRMGYENISMTDRLGCRNIERYRNPWGLNAFDIYYMDNADFCNFNNSKPADHVPFNQDLIDFAVATSATPGNPLIFVFDFHPIHLALNTVSYQTYASERDRYKQSAETHPEANTRTGVRSFYLSLVAEMQRTGLKSKSLSSEVD